MNPYEKIKELTKQNGISVRELEKRLGYSNGYFSKWKNVSPNSDGLAKVADYFGVSVDYLLGREEKTSLAEKHGVFAFDGDPVTNEEVEFLKSVLAAKRAAENK
ncbi:helix-turn-helix transcriptional regulator [Enterococcus dongliensis]|uniref:helix-turn-helix domain-containing protein n=1 Tax=Enterococcus dongliensis TaxID=2559925 RepID=UPI00288CD098|nr:helix-turn-helix transcriptional regulator [Enterococcus dongliensis]MDT2640416.1 helix-turn-helix transcriptional regulator [Enterococcus dongliensis]